MKVYIPLEFTDTTDFTKNGNLPWVGFPAKACEQVHQKLLEGLKQGGILCQIPMHGGIPQERQRSAKTLGLPGYRWGQDIVFQV